jgi:hypothetical protein
VQNHGNATTSYKQIASDKTLQSMRQRDPEAPETRLVLGRMRGDYRAADGLGYQNGK